ncbi:ATP phosphoribosyltransferase [Chloroflexi bacterium TSY]|nr:ATP phosphoribosyltransferase [Chloroflexi bacterium TSY]
MTHDQQVLTIALPKGRIERQSLELFQKSGLSTPKSRIDRKLISESPDQSLRYVQVKPTDVPTFVEYGAADLGVCGLDTLRESRRNVYEPLQLPFGHCRLSVCALANRVDTPLRHNNQPRIATKFPNLALEYFRDRDVSAEIIQLHGSVELGPLVGLADLIVDIVETGATLRDNGLVELRKIMDIQSILIINQASYRVKSSAVQYIVDTIKKVLNSSEPHVVK